MEHKAKISVLWITIMIGFCVHTFVDMLPLFFGGNVAIPESTGIVPNGMYAFMGCIMYLIPIIAILITLYGNNKTWQTVNLIIAILMLIANIFHASELFKEFNWGQFFVLPIILILNVLLIIAIVQLLKSFKVVQDAK